MKFAKFFAYLTACLIIAGCEKAQVEKSTTAYAEICVDGVIYLRSGSGFLTVKVNADYYPVTCVIKEKNNG